MSNKIRPFPVIDGHVDLLYMMMRSEKITFSDLTNAQITTDRLKQGNVRVIVSAFYCMDRFNGPERSVPHLKSLTAYADDKMRWLLPVKTERDLKKCFSNENETGSISLLENADALVDLDLSDIKDLGFNVIGLTHAGKNRIADGNSVRNPSYITNKGKELIRGLSSLGTAIDVAHLAEPGFWEIIDLFDGPIISSHTGFRTFCDLPRNLSDEQLKVLIERGGMVGVSVNPEMLSVDQKAGITDVFYQIDWVVQKHGEKNLGIGSDFGGFDVANQGLEHPGRFGNLSEIFVKHGYCEDAIAGIMGKNWYVFYSSLLG